MLLLEAVKCKRDRRLFLESNNGADHKMNTTKSKHSASWENDEVSVDIPFSVAGVGTTVAITSKFTGNSPEKSCSWMLVMVQSETYSSQVTLTL
jgi:hypothetical protein